jgi:hypothetical protein
MTAFLRSKPHFVLGYNGCDRDDGESALRSEAPDGLVPSNNGYDWLGTGIYFWEADPVRAHEWALETSARHVRRNKDKGTPIKLRRPFAVGALINLGNCLDLTTVEGVEILTEGYESYLADFKELRKASIGLTLPANKRTADGKMLAYLDDQVINYTCRHYEKQRGQPIDTVRALFPEGDKVYPGSQFRKKTHTQICVRKPASAIMAYFRIHGMTFA